MSASRWAPMLWTALLLLCLGSGCLPAPLCSAHGGKPWFLQTSPHYVLLSDVGEGEAGERLRQFEAVYESLEGLAFHSERERPRERLQVILFRSRGDYQSVVSSDTAGQFHHSGLNSDDPPYIVMFGDLDNDAQRTFQHELTHYFVAHYAPSAPLWLTEGLATYYETLRQQDAAVHIGLPNPVQLRALFAEGVVPLSELLGAGRKEFYGGSRRYYASAWLLLHLLNNGPQGYADRLYSYVNALSGGTGLGVAFDSAFGDLGTGRLGAEYKAYLDRVEMTYLSAPLRHSQPVLSQRRRLSPAEAHLIWAALRNPAQRSQARQQKRDLDEALEHDPQAPDVLYHRARWYQRQGQPDLAEPLFKQALAARPSEARYLSGLLRLYVERSTGAAGPRPPDEEAILARLLPVAQSAAALDTIARFHAGAGRADASTYFAKRAVASDPRCQSCRFTLAQRLIEGGQYAGAVHEMERAINLLPHGAIPSPSTAERLARLRGRAWREFKKQLGERVSEAATQASASGSAKLPVASCTVCLRMDYSGQLSSSAVSRSSGDPRFDQSVQEAIRDLHGLAVAAERPGSEGSERCLVLTPRRAQPVLISEQP